MDLGNISKILVVGCGGDGAKFVAALGLRAPTSVQTIYVSIADEKHSETAKSRVLGTDPDLHTADIERVKFLRQGELLSDNDILYSVDLVIFQLPPNPHSFLSRTTSPRDRLCGDLYLP